MHDQVFAYYLNNHHGDGIIGIACKVLDGDNEGSLLPRSPKNIICPHTSARADGWACGWM